MTYNKPWLSVAQQIHQLAQRGMEVADVGKAIDFLERTGYYRLSGYWYDFRQRGAPFCALDKNGSKPKKIRIEKPVLDEFKAGTRYQDAVELYVFDKKLRILVLDALERIEIALRVDISHRLGQKDKFAYLRPELFHESFGTSIDPNSGLTRHHVWLSKHAGLIVRSRETFMTHHKEKYGLPVPIWIACEVWDFGCTSTLYAGLKVDDQDVIAQAYGLSNGRTFSSWLRALNYMRNVCAHHGRLWNRNIVEEPKLPPRGAIPALDAFVIDSALRTKPFLLLCICQHLMKIINPSSTWGARLRSHMQAGFPDLAHLGVSLRGMGVDESWDDRDW